MVLEGIILIASILNFLLGILVWKRNWNGVLNRSFGLFGIITGLWVFNNFISKVIPDIYLIRNSYALGAIVPVVALFWIYYLCDGKFSRIKNLSFLFIGALFFILSHCNGLIVEELNNVNASGYEGITGPLFPFYVLYMLVLFFIVLYKLFTSKRKSVGTI